MIVMRRNNTPEALLEGVLECFTPVFGIQPELYHRGKMLCRGPGTAARIYDSRIGPGLEKSADWMEMAAHPSLTRVGSIPRYGIPIVL